MSLRLRARDTFGVRGGYRLTFRDRRLPTVFLFASILSAALVPAGSAAPGGYVALFEPTIRGDGVELTEGDLATMTVQSYLDVAEGAAAAASAASATSEQVERSVGDTLRGLPPIPGLTPETAYGEGFENGLGDWSSDGYGRDWALVSGIARSGNYSIEATANDGWRSIATPPITLEAGTYALRWWEDITRPNSDDKLALLIRTDRANWTLADDARVSTTGWEEASYRFTLDDPGNVQFGFYVDAREAPARWGVDDVSVERVLAIAAPDLDDPTRGPVDPTGPIPIGNFDIGGISRIRETGGYENGGGCCTESYNYGSDWVVVQGVGGVYNSWSEYELDHDHGSSQHGSSFGQQAVGTSTVAGNAAVFRAWSSDHSEDANYSYVSDALLVGAVACAPDACLFAFAGAGERTWFGRFLVVRTNVGAVTLAADEAEPSATLYVNALVVGYREVPLIP